MITSLIYPEPISAARIAFLSKEKGITEIIAALDFSMIKLKLQEPDEGEDWTTEQCESAEIEYKRYLHLCKLFGPGIVPNKIMDAFWHYHILDTRAYHADCEKVFRGYLHHYPYFGMRGEQDAVDLHDAFLVTKQRYLDTFNEEMSREDQEMKCWHDCQNRCWHACSNGK
jgi:hypothetical protein